jgi:antitoxin ParD1/3/4
MNISLTPELEKLVNDKIASGMYNSATEVIQEALILLKEKDAIANLKLQELRQDIQAGINSGESVPFDIEKLKIEGRKRRNQEQ